MNRVILMGRLTRDPEVRYSQDGTISNARYTLAVYRHVSRNANDDQPDKVNAIILDFIETINIKQ